MSICHKLESWFLAIINKQAYFPSVSVSRVEGQLQFVRAKLLPVQASALASQAAPRQLLRQSGRPGWITAPVCTLPSESKVNPSRHGSQTVLVPPRVGDLSSPRELPESLGVGRRQGTGSCLLPMCANRGKGDKRLLLEAMLVPHTGLLQSTSQTTRLPTPTSAQRAHTHTPHTCPCYVGLRPHVSMAAHRLGADTGVSGGLNGCSDSRTGRVSAGW